MCTTLSFNTKDHYFGRNLDLDFSYGEEVCVIPRRFPLNFKSVRCMKEHYAIICMATVVCNVPLLYDGANEYGLAMAGLNFPGNAYYSPICENKDNIAPFEFIPWILGQCKTVKDSRAFLNNVNISDVSFSEKLPNSPLHWIIADREEAIVVEAMKDSLHVYDNPVGVLTNNPPFNYHLFNLNNYRRLSVSNGENSFSEILELEDYCQGLGAMGLPGDVSSMSRFVRAVFNKENSVCNEDEMSSVGQFFHLLTSVEMVRGVCRVPNGKYDITVYSSCMNTDKGLYYYTTYGNRQISCVDMHKTDLDSDTVSRFNLNDTQMIYYQN